MTKRYVAVAGTIGAGKTSLVRWLEKRYGLKPFFEPHEHNPYLEDFYGDMKRWGFHSQLFFLSHKLELHQELVASKAPAVIDRTIYEDAEIFAKNLFLQRLIDKRDWRVYQRLYEGIARSLPPPDVLIALTCTVRTAKKRIKARARAMEQSIPDSYLKRLHKLYAQWFDSYALSPIVRIRTDDMDYVENLIDLIDLQHQLDEALR
jgi:deoxyadenosine/deoxycytidine kinase